MALQRPVQKFRFWLAFLKTWLWSHQSWSENCLFKYHSIKIPGMRPPRLYSSIKDRFYSLTIWCDNQWVFLLGRAIHRSKVMQKRPYFWVVNESLMIIKVINPINSIFSTLISKFKSFLIHGIGCTSVIYQIKFCNIL